MDRYLFFLLFIALLSHSALNGQDTIANSSINIISTNSLVAIDTVAGNKNSAKKRNQFLIYPLAFYLPETRWGFGVAGFYSFRFKGESSNSNPSQSQFSINYTQNKQIILTFPFEIYKNENRLKLKGELGYFRYFYNFYGIGNDSKLANKERYEVHFPRFRLDVLQKYLKSYIGLRYRFDNFDIKKIVAGGILDTQPITGKNGGYISGVGVLWQYDTRNFLYNPTKGVYMETEFFTNQSWTGSDFTYYRFLIDASKYFKLSEDHTLAINLKSQMLWGDPIFYDLPYFGSPSTMRGYQDRRFSDKTMTDIQAEYRYPIYRRLQGVAFVSTGNVGNDLPDLFSNTPKFSYGAGLRFILNKRDRVRIRLDYGRSWDEGGAFYATINDAF